MTSEERRVRIQAGLIRTRFAKQNEMIRSIVEKMSDSQLVAAEAEHHKVRVKAMAEKPQRPPVHFASETQPVPTSKTKRRWFGLRKAK
jgi:hypothetical protein